jgi:DNA-binding NarL/FixJ family response regulator
MTAALLERLIRIVIVDDNALERGTLRFILERFPNLKVLGEVGDGYAAIDMVVDFQPDVVLMDVRMPVLDGIEATRIISSQFPDTKVIVLTMDSDKAYSDEAYRAGACQFLTKDCGEEKLLTAINECSPGRRMISGYSLH